MRHGPWKDPRPLYSHLICLQDGRSLSLWCFSLLYFYLVFESFIVLFISSHSPITTSTMKSDEPYPFWDYSINSFLDFLHSLVQTPIDPFLVNSTSRLRDSIFTNYRHLTVPPVPRTSGLSVPCLPPYFDLSVSPPYGHLGNIHFWDPLVTPYLSSLHLTRLIWLD